MRGYDVLWLLLFSALAWMSPHRDTPEVVLLALIAIVEIATPRIPGFESGWRAAALILTKLLLSYLFIGFSGGINSSFYLLMLLPIVSAAVTLNAWGTAGVTLLSGGAYASFLGLVDPARFQLDESGLRELGLRLLFLCMGGFLTFQQAEQTRQAARRYLAVARELEQANQNLQKAEDAIRRQDRLAALGQMTAGLAHELRNPLGTIRASAELLTRRTASDPTTSELAAYIASEVDRTNSLVSRFLDFARPLRLTPTEIDVNAVLDTAAAEALRNPAFTGITLVKNYAPNLPLLNGDAELLRIAFLNLLLNAAQASAPGATVTLKTRPAPAGVDISVIDRGLGIPAAHLDSIFNPFFSTKAGGVGLGLPIVSKIIAEHGGQIQVQSDEGQGSVFRITLPLRPDPRIR
jgi:signal transduction histidine kinase